MQHEILSSHWPNLNQNLIARFFRCDKEGKQLPGAEVHAPLSAGAIEIRGDWESAFESSRRSLTGTLLQVGLGVAGVGQTFLGKKTNQGTVQTTQDDSEGSFWQRLKTEAAGFATATANKLGDAEGRTGMTKLTSTRIYAGSSPVNWAVSAHFRAFSDAGREVEDPVAALASWVLSEELAVGSRFVAGARAASNGDGWAKVLFPSLAPPLIGITFSGKFLAPMVIDSISYDTCGPKDRRGRMLSAEVKLNLSSWTAMDARDWENSRRGGSIVTTDAMDGRRT